MPWPFSSGLTNLRSLFLRDNSIPNILQDTFEACPALTKLDLGSNAIQYIEDVSHSFAALPQLTHLYLDYNTMNLLSPTSFASNQHLQQLDLSYNRILIIEKDTFRSPDPDPPSLPLLNPDPDPI